MAGPSLTSPPLATPGSERRQCRFFEYTSLIPEQDYEQAPSPVANQGRPRLCSRTYSLPVPVALSDLKSHFGIQCPYNPKEDDPSFIPNGPSRFSVKLPSITRRRRSTIGSGPPLRSCLKGSSSSSSRPGYPRAPASSASTASSSSTFNPIYCPALARITSSPSSLPNPAAAPDVALAPSSSRASTSTAASASTSAVGKAGISLRPLVIPQLAPEELPEDLEPLSPCCDRCYDAVEYAECTPAHKYTEKWSQAALKKRERDERLALQRGKRQEAAKPKPAWCQRLADLVDELPVPEGVDELEMCKKRRARKEKESRAELDAEEAADEQGQGQRAGPPPCAEASVPLETVKEEERPAAKATTDASSAPAGGEDDETSSRDSFASERSATTDAKSPASSAASSLTSDTGFAAAKPTAISAASSTPSEAEMHAGSPPCRMASLRPVSSAQSAPRNSADSLTEAYKSADRHMEPAVPAPQGKAGGKKEKFGSWGRVFGRSFGG